MDARYPATTRSYTGNTTFPMDFKRDSFFITFTTGDGTLRFGDEGGEIPLVEGGHYKSDNSVAEITVTTVGTFVVHTNSHGG